LAKVSLRIQRKPAKGGLANALFLQAAVEELPAELNGIANEIHVHFPWGSLLRALVQGEERVLGNLRRICATGALLQLLIGLDPLRDRAEIARLGLPPMADAYLDKVLLPRYQAAGFDVLGMDVLSPAAWPTIPSSWAKRLRGNPGRCLTSLRARASAAATLCTSII